MWWAFPDKIRASVNPWASQSTTSRWVLEIITIHVTKSRVKIWKAGVYSRSKRGHVSLWSFDVIKIGERAFVHFHPRIVHRLLTNKKYMCMSELVHSRVISCEKFCWITLLDILLTSSCRHRPCTWTWRFTRLQIELWRSSFGAKVVQSWP